MTYNQRFSRVISKSAPSIPRNAFPRLGKPCGARLSERSRLLLCRIHHPTLTRGVGSMGLGASYEGPATALDVSICIISPNSRGPPRSIKFERSIAIFIAGIDYIHREHRRNVCA